MARKKKNSTQQTNVMTMLFGGFAAIALLFAMAVSVVLTQEKTSSSVDARGKKDFADSCITLSNEIKRAQSSTCGDRKYFNNADLNYDEVVNELDQVFFASYANDSAWCEKALVIRHDACEDNSLDPACGQLWRLFLIALNTREGDDLYNSIVDFNNDGFVSVGDFSSYFLPNQDNPTWCQAQL